MTEPLEKKVSIWREELLPPSETFILNQAHALQRWDFELGGLRMRPGGLDVGTPFVLTGRPRLGRIESAAYHRFGAGPQLTAHLRRAQVVHAHFGPDAVRLLPAVRLARRPLVVTFHGYDVTADPSSINVTYGELFVRATWLIAVSRFIRERLVERGAPEEKVVVRPVGIPVPPDVEPPAAEHRRVLFVGRLVEKKGCGDLLDAVAGLRDPPKLCLIGDGPLRKDLEAQAERLRLDAHFMGYQPPAAVREAMKTSTAFCVPSRASTDGDREGFGMVFLEAAAHRLPVVSYRSGGVPEAVADGQTGLLADEADASGLRDLLARVLSEPELGRRLGDAGRRRVETQFDIRGCTVDLEDLYDETAFLGAAQARLRKPGQ